MATVFCPVARDAEKVRLEGEQQQVIERRGEERAYGLRKTRSPLPILVLVPYSMRHPYFF